MELVVVVGSFGLIFLMYALRDLFFEMLFRLLFKLFFPIIRVISRDYSRWDKLPSLAEYLAHHEECKTNNGISCATCNSKSIKNWGLKGANDAFRIFICNHCDTDLYKK